MGTAHKFPKTSLPIIVEQIKRFWSDLVIEDVMGNLIEDIPNTIEELFIYKNFEAYQTRNEPQSEESEFFDLIYLVNSVENLFVAVDENEEVLKILESVNELVK
jgi:hypothetical protein